VPDLPDALRRTAERVADYRSRVGERPVAPPVDAADLRATLGGPLPERGADPDAVIDQLVEAVDPALTASVGPRYFGFVVGGALESATRADMLVTGWDQMAFNAVSSPAAAIAEEVAGGWLKEVLGLPAGASFGFVTGAQGANTVGLAAARHRVLARAGWDVEARGLAGSPGVRVLVGARCGCWASAPMPSSRCPRTPRARSTWTRWSKRSRPAATRPPSSPYRRAT
jgi:glutamate/tyrosine decarboxylase-like PLP-dependent enzyme